MRIFSVTLASAIGLALLTPAYAAYVGQQSIGVGGFTPTPSYSQLAFSSAASHRTAVPSGAVDVIYNTSSGVAYCTFGSASVTATAADDVVQGNSWLALTVPSGAVDIACIAPGGTLAINVSGGSGLPTGAGGGGSGGGGSVGTVATPDVTGYNVGGTGTVDAGSAYGRYTDESTSSQFHTDLTSPLAAQSSHTVEVGLVSLGLAGAAVTTTNPVPVVNVQSQQPNEWDGATATTGTGAQTLIAASGSGSLHEYMTGLQCARDDTGTTAIYVSLTDATKTRVFVLPNSGSGGGNNATFPSPIQWAFNHAVTVTASAVTTSGTEGVVCNAQGFNAS